MGSDAVVYVFDYAKYLDDVVPAVREWVRSLSLPEWGDWRVVAGRTLPLFGTDIAAHSTSLGDDLRDLRDLSGTSPIASSWEDRRCRSDSCLSRHTCPWHADDPEAVSLIVAMLIAKADVLGPSQFVGRSVVPQWYAAYLESLGHGPASRLQGLLSALGSRGRLVGYFDGMAAEGINGWLDPAETEELVREIFALALPDVGQWEEIHDRVRANSSNPFEPWSLAILLAVARKASADGKGLLWANDLWWETPLEVALRPSYLVDPVPLT